MATLATPIRDEAIYRDPACVKVVCSTSAGAPSTSRGARSPAIATACPTPPRPCRRSRICTSASTRIAATSCFDLGSLPPSPLEAAEKLEQLRVLEAGYPIAVGIVDEPSVGIDTPEDYRRFVGAMAGRRGSVVPRTDGRLRCRGATGQPLNSGRSRCQMAGIVGGVHRSPAPRAPSCTKRGKMPPDTREPDRRRLQGVAAGDHGADRRDLRGVRRRSTTWAIRRCRAIARSSRSWPTSARSSIPATAAGRTCTWGTSATTSAT